MLTISLPPWVHREEAQKVYEVPYDSSSGLSLTCFGLGMNQRFTFGTANDVWHDNVSFLQVLKFAHRIVIAILIEDKQTKKAMPSH